MTRRPDTAMVFAAGLGTRMRPLTDRTPKPLIEVAGRTLLDRALDRLAEAGIRRAVVNTHHLADRIEAHLAAETRLDIAISRETPDILETGGGLRHAAPLLGPDPIWTMNPDVIFAGPNPFDMLADPIPGGARLLIVPRERAVGHPGRGDFFLDPDGTLRRRGGADTAPYIYASVQLLDPAPVYAVPDTAFSLNRAWDDMLARGRLMGEVYPGHWCDVGTPGAIPLAEALLAHG